MHIWESSMNIQMFMCVTMIQRRQQCCNKDVQQTIGYTRLSSSTDSLWRMCVRPSVSGTARMLILKYFTIHTDWRWAGDELRQWSVWAVSSQLLTFMSHCLTGEHVHTIKQCIEITNLFNFPNKLLEQTEEQYNQTDFQNVVSIDLLSCVINEADFERVDFQWPWVNIVLYFLKIWKSDKIFEFIQKFEVIDQLN